MKIIIGIPTYNRPESLIRRLNEIDSYGDKITGVVVCDNSDRVNTTAEAICKAKTNWFYYKNEDNLGGGANFIRVIEKSPEGTHLWWRGDDDPITKEQIDAVINSNIKDNDLLLLKPENSPVFKGTGIQEFSKNFKEINPFGWLSMVVLPLNLAKKSLRYGYWGIYTGWANVTLILGMFRIEKNLRFYVVPFELKRGDFREIGQAEGQWWALFNTCIKNFALTADMIPDTKIRRLYLKQWRKTQRYSLPKSLLRGRLGIGKQEKITWSTLSPLLSFDNPDKVPLFIILYGLAKLPRFIPRFLVALWAGNKSAEVLQKMGLAYLNGKFSLWERNKILKTKMNPEIASTFL